MRKSAIIYIIIVKKLDWFIFSFYSIQFLISFFFLFFSFFFLKNFNETIYSKRFQLTKFLLLAILHDQATRSNELEAKHIFPCLVGYPTRTFGYELRKLDFPWMPVKFESLIYPGLNRIRLFDLYLPLIIAVYFITSKRW